MDGMEKEVQRVGEKIGEGVEALQGQLWPRYTLTFSKYLVSYILCFFFFGKLNIILFSIFKIHNSIHQQIE